jgi:hypothetical protein
VGNLLLGVRALKTADDHFPRVLLSLDPLPPVLPDGLLYQDARAFLAGRPPWPQQLR